MDDTKQLKVCDQCLKEKMCDPVTNGDGIIDAWLCDKCGDDLFGAGSGAMEPTDLTKPQVF